MSLTVDWTEGMTAPEEFVLKQGTSSTSLTAVDLTALTVELSLKNRLRNTVPTTGDVAIVTAASGIVKYTPDATDLDAEHSPYKAKFKVTYGDGSIRYFPQGEAMTWNVHPA